MFKRMFHRSILSLRLCLLTATWIFNGHQPKMTIDDWCWPSQNFNIDDTLRCTGVTLNNRGWGGIYYKSGSSTKNFDWDHWTATFSVYITAPCPALNQDTNNADR